MPVATFSGAFAPVLRKPFLRLTWLTGGRASGKASLNDGLFGGRLTCGTGDKSRMVEQYKMFGDDGCGFDAPRVSGG